MSNAIDTIKQNQLKAQFENERKNREQAINELGDLSALNADERERVIQNRITENLGLLFAKNSMRMSEVFILVDRAKQQHFPESKKTAPVQKPAPKSELEDLPADDDSDDDWTL